MGCTIATPIRDEGSKARMLAFLEKNFRHWSEIACEERDVPRYYHGPVPDGELDYDRGACRIGFNFHTSGYDREYIFTVCRWMALKCGRVDLFNFNWGGRCAFPSSSMTETMGRMTVKEECETGLGR